MDGHALRSLFKGLVALHALNVAGCGDSCSTSWATYDFEVPPKRIVPAGATHDAGVDAAATATATDGTLEEWLALPCAQACARVAPGNAELESCEPARVDPGGHAYVRCELKQISCHPTSFGGGRPPMGYRPFTPPSQDVAQHLLHLAEIEAASVGSFLDLARDLEASHLPATFVAAARRFARDEHVHAAMMRRLADRASGVPRHRGSRPRRYGIGQAARRPPMDLLALATANVAEGCVGELFAAALATWAAESQADSVHRAAFERIAHDETQHASFALALQRKLEERLTALEKERVDAAREHAICALRASLYDAPALTLAGVHPPMAFQRRAFDALFAKAAA